MFVYVLCGFVKKKKNYLQSSVNVCFFGQYFLSQTKIVITFKKFDQYKYKNIVKDCLHSVMHSAFFDSSCFKICNIWKMKPLAIRMFDSQQNMAITKCVWKDC